MATDMNYIDKELVKELYSKIIIMEKNNIVTKRKTDSEMIKDIKKLIEERVNIRR